MNRASLIALIEKRWTDKDDNPIVFDAYVHQVASLIGRDRASLITFIEKEGKDYVYALGEAYEEIMENFPGDDELNNLFIQKVLP